MNRVPLGVEFRVLCALARPGGLAARCGGLDRPRIPQDRKIEKKLLSNFSDIHG